MSRPLIGAEWETLGALEDGFASWDQPLSIDRGRELVELRNRMSRDQRDEWLYDRLSLAEDRLLLARALFELEHRDVFRAYETLMNVGSQMIAGRLGEEDALRAGARLLKAAWLLYVSDDEHGVPSRGSHAWWRLIQLAQLLPETGYERQVDGLPAPDDLVRADGDVAAVRAVLERIAQEQGGMLGAVEAVTLAQLRNEDGCTGTAWAPAWHYEADAFQVRHLGED